MTKEEALAILKYNSKVIHQTINGETDPNEVEALDLAIKALEQQPSDKEKLEKVERIVNNWNNDASHSFEDMCKINGILKE